jgi:hypothetical protein
VVPTIGFKPLETESSRYQYSKLVACMIVCICRLASGDAPANGVNVLLPSGLRQLAQALVAAASVPGHDENIKHLIMNISYELVFAEHEGMVNVSYKHVLEQLLIFSCVDYDGQMKTVYEVTPVIAKMEYWCRITVLHKILEEFNQREHGTSR